MFCCQCQFSFIDSSRSLLHGSALTWNEHVLSFRSLWQRWAWYAGQVRAMARTLNKMSVPQERGCFTGSTLLPTDHATPYISLV
jgi:hypothetical protein